MHKRERLLAIGVAVLVGGWALDAMLIGPGLAWLAKLRAEGRAAATEAAEASLLVDRSKQIMDRWRAWHASGVLDDEDAARFRAQQAVTGAARDSSCTIDTLGGGQRVPAAQGQTYDLLRLTVSGQGSLAEVQDFLAALESAPQPLRIERCELAARDPRKDALDLSLTLSTRIAAAKTRDSRAVPEGTQAWTPEPRDGALDAAVREARPFLGDRRSGRVATAAVETPASTPAHAGTWALVGVVTREDGAIGFLRHLGSGEERTVRAGDSVGDARVAAIDTDGMRLAGGETESTVRIGTDLAGQAVPAGGARSSAPAATGTPPSAPIAAPVGATPAGAPATTAPAAAASAAAAPAAGADREAILQRLRERRNRTPGNSP